ncbi:MAG: hypothetical protein ACFE85_13345 [Candidatus Hodarchaeota archaeon]
MEQVQSINRNQLFKSTFVNCDICKEEIKYRALFYESGINSGVLCESCHKKFQESEIELMMNLFNVYGGYFGKFKKLKTSVYKRLKEQGEGTIGKGEFSNADKINLELLHKALLFGFSPKEFFEGLKNIN